MTDREEFLAAAVDGMRFGAESALNTVAEKAAQYMLPEQVGIWRAQLDAKLQVFLSELEGLKDWIEWNGGRRKGPGVAAIEVKFRNGSTCSGFAYEFSWGHATTDHPREFDIVAYRRIGDE